MGLQGPSQEGECFQPRKMLFKCLSSTGLKVSVLRLKRMENICVDDRGKEVAATAECQQKA